MKVVTCVVNNPKFIELQYFTLARYMKCDYEFIVFNDAKDWPDFTNGDDPTVYQQIVDTCAGLGIQCINIPNSHHKTNTVASARTADAHNFLLGYMRSNPDQYLTIDSDMFLIDDFDGTEYKEKACAVSLQSRGSTHYIWNGLYYFDIKKMEHMELMNWELTHNTDTGGCMEPWLRKTVGNSFPSTDAVRWTAAKYETPTLLYLRHLWSLSWNDSELPGQLKDRTHLRSFLQSDPRNSADGKYFAELYDNKFFHYRAGGNWRGEGMDLHANLTSRLMDAILNDF